MTPLEQRPEAPVLLVHARADIAEDWLAAHVEAAEKAYPGFCVLPLHGLAIDASALTGRDVVIWPWMGAPSQRAQLRPAAGVLARTAKRVRLIAPAADEAIGPAGLNGHDPIAWARERCEEVPASADVDLHAEWFGGEDDVVLAEPPPELTHERVRTPLVSAYATGAIIDTSPDPVDFFARAPLPRLLEPMLSPALAPFIFDQSQIIGSDPCILAMASLVSCAAVTSDFIRIQPKAHEHSWKESARLWGAFVGDPSVKKTPPLNRATSHLRKLDMQYGEEGAEALARFKIQEKIYAKAEAKWIDDQAKNRPCGPLQDAPTRPPIRRVIVQDATIEAVADVLVDNPQGVLVLWDELSGFFGSMDAYRNQGSKDRAFWLEAYNGGPRRIDRVGRGAMIVPNASVCMLGGIQPSAIRGIAAKSVEDGLLQRFMIVCAEAGKSVGEDRRADVHATTLYRGIVDHLARQDGDPEKPVELDGGARARMIHVEQKLQAFTAMEDLPVRMRYQLGKWSGLFARLCLTYHAIECAALGLPVTGFVAADIAERVDRFMFEYLFWHLQYFYETVIGDTEPRDQLLAKVARWLLAKAPERFTERDLTRGVQSWQHADWWARHGILERLRNGGWIEKDRPTAAGAPAWSLNTVVRTKFAEQARLEEERRADYRRRLLGEIDVDFTEPNEG